MDDHASDHMPDAPPAPKGRHGGRHPGAGGKLGNLNPLKHDRCSRIREYLDNARAQAEGRISPDLAAIAYAHRFADSVEAYLPLLAFLFDHDAYSKFGVANRARLLAPDPNDQADDQVDRAILESTGAALAAFAESVQPTTKKTKRSSEIALHNGAPAKHLIP